MDSRTALERLDAVRPGSDDLALPDLAEAGEVLLRDSEVAAEFERRQALDVRIAAAMHDVPVPTGLKERLLAQLPLAESVAVAPARTRVSRRHVLALLSGVAASVLAAGVYWVANAQPQPVSVEQLRETAEALRRGEVEATIFHGHFEPQPPAGHWRTVRFEPVIYGLAIDGTEHRAAAWRFTLGGRIGVLAVIPASEVTQEPTERSIFDRGYIGPHSVAWSESGFVYVCTLEGGIDPLLRHLDGGRLA
jgi:hypothetical protein